MTHTLDPSGRCKHCRLHVTEWGGACRGKGGAVMARRYRKDSNGKRRLVTLDPNSGAEGYMLWHSDYCSGCTEYGDYGTRYGPFGCDECGYTGRRRHHVWTAFDCLDPALMAYWAKESAAMERPCRGPSCSCGACGKFDEGEG